MLSVRLHQKSWSVQKLWLATCVKMCLINALLDCNPLHDVCGMSNPQWFPSQSLSNAEGISMSWHHHEQWHWYVILYYPILSVYVILQMLHYSEVIMGTLASQIISLTIVYPTIYSGADQRKHRSSMSLAFVRGIHRWPVNSLHKWSVTWKMFPFDDVFMVSYYLDGAP